MPVWNQIIETISRNLVFIICIAGACFITGFIITYHECNPYTQPKAKGYRSNKYRGESAKTDSLVMKAYKMKKDGMSEEDIYKSLLKDDTTEHHSNKDF